MHVNTIGNRRDVLVRSILNWNRRRRCTTKKNYRGYNNTERHTTPDEILVMGTTEKRDPKWKYILVGLWSLSFHSTQFSLLRLSQSVGLVAISTYDDLIISSCMWWCHLNYSPLNNATGHIITCLHNTSIASANIQPLALVRLRHGLNDTSIVAIQTYLFIFIELVTGAARAIFDWQYFSVRMFIACNCEMASSSSSKNHNNKQTIPVWKLKNGNATALKRR